MLRLLASVIAQRVRASPFQSLSIPLCAGWIIMITYGARGIGAVLPRAQMATMVLSVGLGGGLIPWFGRRLDLYMDLYAKIAWEAVETREKL